MKEGGKKSTRRGNKEMVWTAEEIVKEEMGIERNYQVKEGKMKSR